MNVEVTTTKATKVRAGALVVGMTKGGALPSQLDEALGGALSRLLEAGDFRGKAEDVLPFHPPGGVEAQRIILAGLGEEKKADLESVRRSLAVAARRARKLGAADVAVAVETFALPDLTLSDIAQAIVEGAVLGLYRYTEYKDKPEDEKTEVEGLTLVAEDATRNAVEEGGRFGELFAEATVWARDVDNRPGNSATPAALAELAQRIAEESESLTCKVLEIADMQELGMGALLGVAQGSDEPAKFIILEYMPDVSDVDTVVLVGKGITFDSGGISIKPSSRMEDMKFDKSGAVAVLATMRALPRLRPTVRVVGIAPATENLPSGKAYKPGDIVRAMNGTTIEVVNTDAEGRMILADALAYAARYEPKAVIDLATLTGGCIVALGHEASGLFGTDEQLLVRVRQAGEKTGDRVWPLPLWEPYRKLIESKVADIKNSAGRWASAITAAAFLERFTKPYPWAHVDIAGTAYATGEPQNPKPYAAHGSTGVGVRLLLQLLRDWETAE